MGPGGTAPWATGGHCRGGLEARGLLSLGGPSLADGECQTQGPGFQATRKRNTQVAQMASYRKQPRSPPSHQEAPGLGDAGGSPLEVEGRGPGWRGGGTASPGPRLCGRSSAPSPQPARLPKLGGPFSHWGSCHAPTSVPAPNPLPFLGATLGPRGTGRLGLSGSSLRLRAQETRPLNSAQHQGQHSQGPPGGWRGSRIWGIPRVQEGKSGPCGPGPSPC